jgi:2-amino-4-hydroxy-6-hydroxymethyldihydropteridine diphosphokinase
MNTVFLGLGSNIGDKENNILKAYDLIKTEIGNIEKLSSFYYSEAWGFESQNSFVNTVIQVKTHLDPLHLLEKLKIIETNMGRMDKTTKLNYEDRSIDIDILFYNNEIFKNEHLCVPHPHINQRLFVLEPLNEFAADFIHPELNSKVIDLLYRLKN